MMVDNYSRKVFITIGIIAVIILSVLLYNQYFYQGSANLSINSASVEPAYYGKSNDYTLNINLYIIFNGKMTVIGYLNVCSFHVSLNSTLWNVIPLSCTGIIGSHTYTGSHDFNLSMGIEPSTSNSTISTPFNLSFMVYSNEFNVNSSYYNLVVNSSSLKVTHASLDHYTQQDGSTGYNINTTFSLTSDQSFNVSYGCTSPFTVALVDSSNWQLVRIDCLAIFTHYLPSGTSNYSLSYQLMNPNGQIYNYTTPLPSNFYIQVTLGNNLLKSNVYTLAT